MTYNRLKEQIRQGAYPSANLMQDSLEYALRREKISQAEYEELSAMLEAKEEAKYK